MSGDVNFRLDWRVCFTLRTASVRSGFLALSDRCNRTVHFHSDEPKPFSPLTRTSLLLAILGGVALVVNWLLLFAAYERISIGLSTVVYNTQPFMLVMMGMLLGERQSGQMGLAVSCLRRGGNFALRRTVRFPWLSGSRDRSGTGCGVLLCVDGDYCPQIEIHRATAYSLYSGTDRRSNASAVCPYARLVR